MWAAGYGQLSSATLLLEAGADKNFQGPEGQTPLHLAAAYGHHDVVKLLLNYGADPDACEDVSYTYLRVIQCKIKNWCMTTINQYFVSSVLQTVLSLSFYVHFAFLKIT